jgi:hypothetical protein
MNKDTIKSILALGLSGLIISLLILPIYKGQKEQFQLDDSGVYKKIKVDQKEEVLGEEDQADWIGGQFKQWSVLENNAGGYKVIYPAGFKIDYSQSGKIVLTPPSGGGQVLGYIKSGEFSTVAVIDGLSEEQSELIKAAETMLKQSFKLTSNPGYNQESAKQRFGQ